MIWSNLIKLSKRLVGKNHSITNEIRTIAINSAMRSKAIRPRSRSR
jgi:hypothetical protein